MSVLTLDSDIMEIQIFSFVQCDLVNFGLLKLLRLLVVVELS